MPTTTNFGWITPVPGASRNIWGVLLNTIFTQQDTTLSSAIKSFVGPTAPVLPFNMTGVFWLNSTGAPVYVLNIHNGTDFVEVGTLGATGFIVANTIVVGDFKLSAIINDHNGWLLCDGRTKLQADYLDLYDAIGDAFTAAPSATTFDLPDMRGRVAGAIGTGPEIANNLPVMTEPLTARTLGNYRGLEGAILEDITQMPGHSHLLKGTDNTGNQSVKSYSLTGLASGVNYPANYSVTLQNPTEETGGNLIPPGDPGNPDNIPLGQALPHPNIQPTLFAGNYFIYSGVVTA